MYNAGLSAYRNLPQKKQAKPVQKSFGLLARSEPREKPTMNNQSQLDKIAEYVSQIRKEREKLKNGRA
jgi:hypothetical protein